MKTFAVISGSLRKESINRKLLLFLKEKYKEEIKKYPHPRSKKAILERAQFWGSIIAIKYAEPFITFRNIL